MRKKITFAFKVLFMCFAPLSAFCQDNIGDLFQSGPADAQKLVGAYFNPLFRGLGVGLNSGWTNTAKAKSPLRFDLRITGTAAFVPNSDKAFDVRSLGLENIRPVDPNRFVAPTAFGAEVDGPEMEIFNSSLPDPNPSTFKLPKGTGLNFVPSPQVQLTVGLPKHIDVSLRLVPDVKIEDGTLNLFGAGIKFELMPILMGKKAKVTPIDLALVFGYTSVNFNLPLDLEGQPTNDQVVDVKIKGYSAEAVISKKILFFTPFASVGIHNSSSKLNTFGTYVFDVPVTPQTPTGEKTFVNPVAINQTDINGLKATLGFQMNLGFFRLYASYTQAEYSYANAGVGFGIGK
ncbi:MAG: DUF6588 family protein [Bacteroidia bacterium]